MRLDPAAWFEDPDRPEVRVFGCDAPEIVPHRGDDAADLAGGKLGQGPFQIAPGLPGYAEKRADQAAEGTADGRGAMDWQCAECAKRQRGGLGLQAMDGANRP